jgi:hypothetical protein
MADEHRLTTELPTNNQMSEYLAVAGTPSESLTQIGLMQALIGCAAGWAPEARLLGNLRAGDIVLALHGALSASLRTVCTYCGHMTVYETVSERDSEAGRMKMFDHLLVCEKRPEGKLLLAVGATRAVLAEIAETTTDEKTRELAKMVLEEPLFGVPQPEASNG